MKKYQKPSVTSTDIEVCHMLAESLPINKETTVDGGDALGKENAGAGWDIWN